LAPCDGRKPRRAATRSERGAQGGAHIAGKLREVIERACETACETERKSLLGELAALLCHPELPDHVRREGMDLAGRLARRASAEAPCRRGLAEMIARAQGRNDS
jgi:hypothetical protein